jgi:hypothetical protein
LTGKWREKNGDKKMEDRKMGGEEICPEEFCAEWQQPPVDNPNSISAVWSRTF